MVLSERERVDARRGINLRTAVRRLFIQVLVVVVGGQG